jgi:hypothetical protein
MLHLKTEMDIPRMKAKPPCAPLWRSAASGLWYRHAGAAGGINACRCETCLKTLERQENETQLHWTGRLANWWSKHTEAKP